MYVQTIVYVAQFVYVTICTILHYKGVCVVQATVYYEAVGKPQYIWGKSTTAARLRDSGT